MVLVNNSIQQNVAGVALLECTGVDIAINNLSYNAIGADLRYSHDNNITGNAIGDNDDGLLVTNSHGNTVTCNNISSSGRYGARVRWSDGNVLHHNNFQGNTIHAQDIGDNTWDDGSGSGNHWSGYTGSDDGSGGRDPGDGVGDDIVPYEGIDHYPYILPSGWLRPGFTAVQGPAGPDADGNFSLSWVPTLRTDRYVLEEDDDPGFLTPAAIYQGGEVNFSVTGRWEGEYYYRVRPESDTYTGMWSDAAHVTVSYLPPAPEILSVTPHAPGNALNVTWDVSGSGISRYRLDYATDGAGPWLRLGTFDHPGDTCDHTGLTDGARYHYRLQAINTLGQSGAFSEAVSGVPADSVAPAPPGGLHATFPTIFALVVQWSASASEDVVAYNVYRSPNGTGGFVKVNDDPVTGLRYIDNGLEEGTEYHYTVTALDEVPNESSQPAPAAGTTLMDAHAPVADAAQDKVRIMEDSRDDEAINLLEWFSDANGDRLKFWAEGLKHLDVLIFPSDGTVVLTPEEDWNGEEKLTFVAWDGDFEARTDVVVNVTAVNDPPETPLIVDPINEISVWEDQGLLLYAMCDDPDLPYGDRLNFTWTVNSTAGEWYGDQVVEPPLPPGVHVITVTVTDTEGEASHAYVRVVIRSIPPEDVDDGGGVTQEGQRDMTWVFYLAVVSLAVIVLWVLLVHRWYGKKAGEHMDEAEKGPARKSRPGTKSPGPPSKGDAGAADPAADENDMPDQAAARMAGDEEPAQGEDEPPDGGDGLPDGGDGATDEDDEAPGAAWDGGEGPRSGGKLSLCGDDWDLDEEMHRSGECADDGAGTDGEVRP
jgi:parallel beta-helix repeat protein